MLKYLLSILLCLSTLLTISYLCKKSQLKEFQSDVEQTSAKLSITNINFGSISINVKKNISLHVINTGKNPLIIYDIETSCGCTEVKWDKKPVKPGKQKKIEIIYKDKYPGMFMKTITVHGNVEKPLVCRITGELVEE